MLPAEPDSGREARIRWLALLGENRAVTFEEDVADDVTLTGSVFLRPVTGRRDVGATLLAAAQIYDRIEFVHSVTEGRRSYLEWDASALGQRMAGVTVLVTDDDELLHLVAIHHRPLPAALAFSVELRRRLIARMDPSFFYRSASDEY